MSRSTARAIFISPQRSLCISADLTNQQQHTRCGSHRCYVCPCFIATAKPDADTRCLAREFSAPLPIMRAVHHSRHSEIVQKGISDPSMFSHQESPLYAFYPPSASLPRSLTPTLSISVAPLHFQCTALEWTTQYLILDRLACHLRHKDMTYRFPFALNLRQSEATLCERWLEISPRVS